MKTTSNTATAPPGAVALPADPAPTYSRVRQALLPAGVVMGVVVIWHALVVAFKVPTVVMPTPWAVLQVFERAAPLLLRNAVPTSLEVLLGFAISTACGILLAVLLASSSRVRQAIYPSVLFFQLIPKITLAPLFILWFGIGMSSRLAFIVFICFFPTVLAATTGLLSTPPEMLKLCRACSARTFDVLVHVRFPHAVPMIFSGLKISVTFAIVGVVVGEFISAQAGLGYLVLFASSQSDTPLALAAIAVLCAVGLALYGLVVWVERVALARLGTPRVD